MAVYSGKINLYLKRLRLLIITYIFVSMFERIGKIPLIAIPFLTVAGCLYHIAFWSKFDINGLAYINVTDIITSSIYPILSFAGFYILLEMLFGSKFNVDEDSKTNGCLVYIINIVLVVLAVYFYEKCELSDWFLWGLGVGSYLSIILYVEGVFRTEIPDNVNRLRTLNALCLALAFSFSSGKIESDKIYLNKEFRYTMVNIGTPNTASAYNTKIKYLGTLGNKYFFTDFSNSKVFIYNNMEAVELYFYKQ